MQCTSYAEYVYQEGVDARDLVRSWLVYIEAKKEPPKKKLPRVVPVFVDLDRQHVRRMWESTKPTLDAMLAVAEIEDPNEITPNTNTCTKYGGCPFKTECGLSPFAGVPSANHEPKKRITIEESKTMGFRDKMNKPAASAPAGNGTAPQPPAQQAAVPPVIAPKPGGFMAKVRGGAPAPAPTPAPTPAPAPAPAKAAPAPQEVPEEVQEARVPTGVVPPDAPARDTMPSPEELEASGKKKVGRPKKERATGFTIYVDCFPTKGGDEPTLLEDWFGPVAMELNEWAQTEKKVADVRLLAFSEEKVAIAQAVNDHIAKGTLPPTMLVSSGSDVTRTVLPLLIPHAKQVVRALRG
jgi:hypothetical protein